jgi:hypothetical protein
MFLTEIKNVGKPDVEINVKYSDRHRTVIYGLLAISALSYTFLPVEAEISVTKV